MSKRTRGTRRHYRRHHQSRGFRAVLPKIQSRVARLGQKTRKIFSRLFRRH
jgi:hypothetical protein